jgi:prolipoprotein diacylglyceryl transferase
LILHASIPSPDESFQVLEVPIGQWLGFLGVPETFALAIHAYALCILAGILLAIMLTSRRLTKRGAEPGVVLDVTLWAVVFGILGSRIFHVLTHPDDYFAGQELWHVVAFWEGGLAIFGALIFGALGVYVGCRFTGLRFWSFADALVPGLLLAQAVGRLGNWFNHELFGWPTDLPWGLEIESTNDAYPLGLPAGTLFHPTFLYEFIWNLLGVAVLLWAGRAGRMQWGKLLGLYLIWYGAGRVVWETIRLDPSELFLGVRTNVWAALAAIVLGIVLIVVQSRRHPGREPSVYVRGREWSGPDAAVDSGETYTDRDEPGDGAASESEQPATSGTKSASALTTASGPAPGSTTKATAS